MKNYNNYRKYHEALKDTGFNELSSIISNMQKISTKYNSELGNISNGEWQDKVNPVLQQKLLFCSKTIQSLNTDVSINIKSIIDSGSKLLDILEQMKQKQIIIDGLTRTVYELNKEKSNLHNKLSTFKDKNTEEYNTTNSKYSSAFNKYNSKKGELTTSQNEIEELGIEADLLISKLQGINFTANITGLLNGEAIVNQTTTPAVTPSPVVTPTPTPTVTPTSEPTQEFVEGKYNNGQLFTVSVPEYFTMGIIANNEKKERFVKNYLTEAQNKDINRQYIEYINRYNTPQERTAAAGRFIASLPFTIPATAANSDFYITKNGKKIYDPDRINVGKYRFAELNFDPNSPDTWGWTYSEKTGDTDNRNGPDCCNTSSLLLISARVLEEGQYIETGTNVGDVIPIGMKSEISLGDMAYPKKNYTGKHIATVIAVDRENPNIYYVLEAKSGILQVTALDKTKGGGGGLGYVSHAEDLYAESTRDKVLSSLKEMPLYKWNTDTMQIYNVKTHEVVYSKE